MTHPITEHIWILGAGVNDYVIGTFSSREKAEKEGSFLQSCGELSQFIVTEYVPKAKVDALWSIIERLDCTQREGGETRHCRPERLCLRCTLEQQMFSTEE